MCATYAVKSPTSKPTKILSPTKLKLAWNQSRDSGRNPGAPGLDGVRAGRFAANLEERIQILHQRICSGSFGFSPLKANLFQKSNGKNRVICIPSVEDRLIQRAIINYLRESKRLPVYFENSFGFERGKGVKEAISECIYLRSQYDYVLETDISSFFDSINRNLLKKKLESKIRNAGIVKLINSAIDIEVRPKNNHQRNEIVKSGIKNGTGLRQGMPLSPLLANLALSDFDRKLHRLNFKYIRYVDDLVVFTNSRQECIEKLEIIKEFLREIDLSLPNLTENGKTKICGKNGSFEFLGREIVFLEKLGRYTQRISNTKMTKTINDKFNFDLEVILREYNTIFEYMNSLGVIAKSLISSYSDAENITQFESKIKNAVQENSIKLIQQIFGVQRTDKIDNKYHEFLGLGSIGEISDSVFDFD